MDTCPIDPHVPAHMALLARLMPRERLVFCHYWGIGLAPLPIRQIAQQLALSRGFTYQILGRATRKLRHLRRVQSADLPTTGPVGLGELLQEDG
jgi:DNA-directed RNA polymerase sigma subunit (sigma70/sigma32)